MDGYGLCTEVRRRLEFKNLFFILYTAIDFTPHDAKFGLKIGADKFIGKQGSPKVVLQAIEEFIAGRGEPRCVFLSRINDFPPATDMQKYSAAMIRQLEEKNIELEQTCRELHNLTEKLKKRLEINKRRMASPSSHLK